MTDSLHFDSLHFDALVIDGHCDTIGEQLSGKRWLGDRSDSGHITDSQLRAIAAKGGVIGVTFVNSFLRRERPETTTIDDVLAHLEYMLAVVGEDHIAIGSDFDGCTPPTDIKDATVYPRITERLQKRGHSETTIRKILGGNFMRIFERVWKQGDFLSPPQNV